MAFNGPKDFTIHGGAHNTVNGPQTIQNITQSSRDEYIVKLLATKAAINATSYAEARYPPPTCHPNTRVSTLQTLSEWLWDKNSTTKVFWVHGAAGVGKSAIAQKTVDDHRDRVVGTFFFSRNDSTRDNLERFVATLAYQCCTSEPLKSVVSPSIIEAIRSNPSIFRCTYEEQFKTLLLKPLLRIQPSQWEHLPNLIVVDGLDECIDPTSQERLLGIINRAIFTIPKAFPFRWLLCSRPEPQICYGINNAHFASVLERVEISATTVRFTGTLTESDLDIQQYFLEKFAELRKKYYSVLRYERKEWPGRGDVTNLVKRASGQFIFAVTVIKYIDTRDERPQDRLQRILDTELQDIQDSPYPALDMLYHQILASCHNWDKVGPILRLLVTPQPRLSDDKWPHGFPQLKLPIITEIFQLRPGEVEILLSKLHSVIRIPQEDGEVHILHASFTEFLLARSRAGDFSILLYSTDEYCHLFAACLLRIHSLYASRYPPYCLSRQSCGAALTEWKERVDNYIEGPWYDDGLLYRMPRYCDLIQMPSANFLAELDEFEPCGAMALLYRAYTEEPEDIYDFYEMFEFPKWLKWAKSLRGTKPQKFIKKMESFLDGCYIAFHTESLDITRIFRIEDSMYSFKWKDYFVLLGEPAGSLRFQELWPGLGRNGPPNCDDLCLFLPTTSVLSMTLPEGYVPVHITKANVEMLDRVYSTYIDFALGKRYDVLNDDLKHNTSVSVNLGLIKEEDFIAYKKLFYERRDLIENPRSYWTALLSRSASQPGPSPRNKSNPGLRW